MVEIAFSNPEGLGQPLGPYSHVTRVKASEFVFIAGQVAFTRLGGGRQGRTKLRVNTALGFLDAAIDRGLQ